MSEATDTFRDWDAAYVLGALDSDDRRDYERHLVGCPSCAVAVAELAGLPGLLSKLPASDAAALLADVDVDIDEHLRSGVHSVGLVQQLASAASRRRRRIRFGMVGAVVAVAALFTAGAIAFTVGQPSVAAAVAMTPVQQHVITASLSVTGKAWGTRFDWSCSYPAASGIYRAPVSYDLVVVQKSGARSVVASWTAAGLHASGLSASSDIAFADIRSVEVRLAGSTATLLREDL